MQVKHQPDGYNTVIPYLIVKDVDRQIDFLQQVFNGTVIEKMLMPDGSAGHSEVRVGDSVIMLGKANDNWPTMPAGVYIFIADTDAAYNKALELGAESVMEPADQFYGDRNAGVKDQEGNTWWLATRKENLTQEELQKRHNERLKK